MGWLDLICLTTDPASTTFYGLAYAADYSTNSDSKYVVLIRTNTNPTSPEDLTWSIVSLFEAWKLAGYPYTTNGSDYTCTSNALGVFTMFGRAAQSDASDSKKAYGIRYDPTGSMDKSFNFKRPGAWMNITVEGEYNWSGSFNRHSLGYVNNGAANVLVHASISSTNNTVSLATVNDSTMTLSPTALWSMNATIHGQSLRALTIGNDHLYTYGDGIVPIVGGAFTQKLYLTGFPLNTTTISLTTPISKSYDAKPAFECDTSPTPLIYFLRNSLTLLCGQIRYSSKDYGTASMFLTIKDPNTSNGTGVKTTFDSDVINMDFFTPIGDEMGLGVSFALLKKEGTMYVFGNDGGTRYTHMISKVNVTETYGVNPNPPPPPAAPKPTILSTGGIVGIVVGALFLAALTFLLGRRTSSRSRNKDDEAADSEANKSQADQPRGDDKDQPQEQGQKDGANFYAFEGKYLVPTYPEGPRSSSTEILPMAPITPAPQHIQEQFHALHNQMQLLQDQLNASQFSSHPRPNFVTSASYIGESITPAVSKERHAEATEKPTTKFSAPWQPTQLIPPACLVDSKGMPSPSAPAYASVVDEAASQAPPDVAPREAVESSENVVSTQSTSSTLDSAQ
ncbi:hypothetical protein BG015_010499 [Linnemannia schmuckeri]|uniref:PI-PLC Y-box domain-containing protein n=1 Tax=Linnemannia schmuckeri TaxID=64567 RepID=A0A9P5V8J6_9FUNG|nr:hypothetical protein BG015_010499 [Linnemannia schmuckeri]